MVEVVDSQKILDTDETISLAEERITYCDDCNEYFYESNAMDAAKHARRAYDWAIKGGFSEKIAQAMADAVWDAEMEPYTAKK